MRQQQKHTTPPDPAPPPTPDLPKQKPGLPDLARLLAGKPLQEEIIDPANPNLIMDRNSS